MRFLTTMHIRVPSLLLTAAMLAPAQQYSITTIAGGAPAPTPATATNAAIKVVDEIKAKLVAAREPGVDKSKVQSEITQLQQQLTSIATSASFSGENWLSVDSADPAFTATKEIVASFTRAADGSVSVGTLTISVANSKLFDSNDQSGILDNDDTTTNGGVAYSVSTLNISAQDFYNSMKWALDLRLEDVDNRAPLLIGLHSDTYSTQNMGYSQPLDQRRKAVSDFLDYALSKPEVRFVSAKQLIQWMCDPKPL